MFENLQSDESRGVSPVIGVILMLAITVTLATVVGAFVVGIGGNLVQPAPQATIEAADAPDQLTYSEYDTKKDGGQDIVSISHRGGDELSHDGIKVVIEHKTKDYKIVDQNLSDRGVYLVSHDVHTNGIVWESNPEAGGEVTVGETLLLTERGPNGGGDDFRIPTGTYEVTLIHEESKSIVDETVVEVK